MTAPAPAARSQEARNVVETGSVKSRAGKENPLLESTCASVKIQITQSRLTTMQVSGPRSRNNRLIAAVIRYKGDACSTPWPKVVAICSRDGTGISLIPNYCSDQPVIPAVIRYKGDAC